MTLVLNTTKQIALDDLLGLERYGIRIVKGYEAEPMAYLWLEGTFLRAYQNDNGFCNFVPPDNADLPCRILDAMVQEFGCLIERMVDGRVVTSLDKQAVIDFHEYELEQDDFILSYINSGCPELQPGSVLCEQTEMARALLYRNPRLREDPQMMLMLVEDLYAQRYPLFRTLQPKRPLVAQFMAEAMLAWAGSGLYAHKTVDLSSEPNRTEYSILPDRTLEWLRLREEAGRQIDPETAEVHWEWGLTLDPYGINPDLPAIARQVQRNYFARSPGSKIWVEFGDLPEATRKILSEKSDEVDVLTFWRNKFRENQA